MFFLILDNGSQSSSGNNRNTGMVRGNQTDPRYTRGRSTTGQRASCHSNNGRSGNWSVPTYYQRENGFAEHDGSESDNTDWKGIAEHQREMLEEM